MLLNVIFLNHQQIYFLYFSLIEQYKQFYHLVLMPYQVFFIRLEDQVLSLVIMMMHFVTYNDQLNIMVQHRLALLFHISLYPPLTIQLTDQGLLLFELMIEPVIFYEFLMCLYGLLMVFGFHLIKRIAPFMLDLKSLRNVLLTQNYIHNIDVSSF